MQKIAPIKVQDEEISVEFTVVVPMTVQANNQHKHEEIQKRIQAVDEQIAECEAYADKLNSKIDNLTNHADKIDYTVAIASGVLCGIIDAVFVGELDLAECREWGSKTVDKFVKKVSGEDNLEKAIKKLEQKTKNFASDPNLGDFGGGLQHHLRDFAHHPTIVGLAFSILTQFTEMCYGTDVTGKFIVVPVKDKTRIADTIPKKLAYATVDWFLHLVSDMAGSHSSAGKGTGIPGPILALAKELSVLPPFSLIKLKNGNQDITISQLISKIFNGTLFAKRDKNGKIIKDSVVGLDLRTGIGILKKQMLPIILNEVIVRSFYSIRRLVVELRENKIRKFSDILHLDWRKIAPVGNRTVERMMTIASGTFMACDMAVAAVKSAGKSAGNPVAFVSSFILNVNFVGIGRFALAVFTDVKMGQKKERLENERVILYSQMLNLTNAKLCYIQMDMWLGIENMDRIEAEMWQSCADTEKTIAEAYETMIFSVNYFSDEWVKIAKSLETIKALSKKVEEKNPGLVEELFSDDTPKINDSED